MERRGQDAYWRTILRLDETGPWNVRSVDHARFGEAGHLRSYPSRKADQATIREYVARLVKAGIAERVGALPPLVPGARPSPTFRLLQRPAASPRLRRDGTPLEEKGTETLWRTLKMMKAGTARQLALYATTDAEPVNRATALRFLAELRRVGVVQRVTKGGPGIEARYRLVQNLGAKPPLVRRETHVLVDRNTGAVLARIA